jgi:lysophospholipase L1-like esterase
VINLAIMAAGLCGLLVLGEVLLRMTYEPHDAMRAAREKYWFRESDQDLTKVYTIDEDFGFRPILDGALYGEHGTLTNDYSIEKRSGIARVLFVGDSVTRRGRIVSALQRRYGDERFEYWNAGVDSFNTVQEVEFFNRYNAPLEPDHVVLTFHNNDFETTPVVFLDDDGKMVLYSPYLPRRSVNGWLFRNTLSYRALLGLLVESRGRSLRADIVSETRRALKELSNTLAHRRIDFTVVILPILDPVEHWRQEQHENHATAVALMEELDLRYYDLLDPMQQALKDGINPREGGEDNWHPSQEIAEYFADHLRAQDLLKTNKNDTH